MSVNNEWTKEIDNLKRQLAEAQEQYQILEMNYRVWTKRAETAEQQLAEERAEHSDTRQICASYLQSFQEERTKREAVEADLATARQARWAAEQECAAALAGAVAVQEACARVCIKAWPKDVTEAAKAIHNLNLPALEAGRALLEPLKQELTGYRHAVENNYKLYTELLASLEPLRKDAARYYYALEHLGIAAALKIKPVPIPCPDRLEGCLVAHYAPVSKATVDAAIDAAIAAGKDRSHDK